MVINNQQFCPSLIRNDDLFVCAISHEHRSFFLLNRIKDYLAHENIIVFYFKAIAKKYWEEIEKLKNDGITVIDSEYNSWKDALDYVVQTYTAFPKNTSIHVDYSSMPRGWYSRIPGMIEQHLKGNDKLFFWYVEAEGYTSIPYGGIKSFDWFSGKPTIRPVNKRVHLIALGYDSVRTQAVLTMLDPDSYITFEASDSGKPEIREIVLEKNKDIISHSVFLVSLDICDFRFMLSKLCDITRDFLTDGDVILVPDGPKPLIMAMSLVPIVFDKKGVTCLHIKRNSSFEDLNDDHDVQPSEKIVGFSIQK